MDNFGRPLPDPSAVSAPFWKAARREKLELQYCKQCHTYQHYPRALCANCWSDSIEWRRCCGKGRVYSYSVCHKQGLPSVTDEAPTVVATVELREGVRMTTNIVGCIADEVSIDMEVEAVFQPVSENCTLVFFQPIDN